MKEYNSLDFFPTRNHEMLNKFILAEDFSNGGCWEPCCGEGDIVEALKLHNNNVFASDIVDYGYADTHLIDFFNCDFSMIPASIVNIVTNPPYTQKRDTRFTLKALEFVRERNGKLAIFMKPSFIYTLGRYNAIFKDNLYSRVYDLISRVELYYDGKKDNTRSFKNNKWDYSWFVWDFTSGELLKNNSIFKI